MSEERTSSFRLSPFRLVDLLAVVVVLAILAGLIFPLLNARRHASSAPRRAECIANQKNVALALINYENAKGGFPAWRQPFATQGRTGSWVVTILPYLEESVAYERFCDNPDISDIRGYGISILQCPSMSFNSAKISYVVNGGMQDLGLDENGNVARTADLDLRSGVFFDGLAEAAPKSTLDYIAKDKGTSNTILTTENSQSGTWWDTDEALTTFVYPAAVLASLTKGDRTSCAAKEITNHRDTWLPLLPGRCPKGLPFFLSGPGDFADYRYARPASPHPGIFVGALCDGSVRTFCNELDPEVFQRLMNAREDGPERSTPIDFTKL